MGALLAAEVFTTVHIAVTAVISGGLAFLAAWLITGRTMRPRTEAIVIGVLTAAAVFLWRKSANLPQLNTDGLQGFSANDWLSPVVTYVWLSLYRVVAPRTEPRRFGKAVVAATVIAFAVNVVTI